MKRRALKKRYGRAARAKFMIGQPVEKTMGVRMSGVVIPAFYWRDATDGTYKAPDRDATWVRWADGTKGWIHNRFLRSL